ncbi:hypothetical protein [Scytonema sp. HK-05]|uniref:hypothetical protein n=1 Tax=Scytonema sp. HK-05 TaxID=1137095 RepID=UPI00093702CC|nr:hypothetical protein [Scytonema sp. HK-05]OKH43077.1 hypothetical protein NIES2130_39080 [Scytonema sp. HK-05]
MGYVNFILKLKAHNQIAQVMSQIIEPYTCTFAIAMAQSAAPRESIALYILLNAIVHVPSAASGDRLGFNL